MKRIKQFFHFQPFSRKQRKVLNWWTETSPVKDYDGIIADGAIRSGKTVSMSLSFVLWAMTTFNGQNFVWQDDRFIQTKRFVLAETDVEIQRIQSCGSQSR